MDFPYLCRLILRHWDLLWMVPGNLKNIASRFPNCWIEHFENAKKKQRLSLSSDLQLQGGALQLQVGL